VQTVAESHSAYVKLADALAVKARTGGAAGLMLSPNASTTDVRKAVRQAARSVLPNATETKVTFTANARALRHFIEQRASVVADPEIRAVANELYHWALTHARNLFNDYAVEPLADGTGQLTTLYRKV
jgi:thymidylate synthase (FAD)